MRFRSKLVDIGCIHQLTRIFTTVSKMTKICALKLSETQLILTQNERVNGGGTNMWCEINQVDYFEEYRIEGKDGKNEIYLEVINENLVRAIRSGQNAQSIKIKLTKKQTPCLTFEISLPSMTSHARVVVHDVPVAVIPSRFWDNFQKPPLPSYDIRISLPNLKVLKSIVERMKNISGFMVISATKSGELRCKVQTDEVTATTHFKNMEIERDGDNNDYSEPDEEEAHECIEARIDIQKLVIFLNVQQFNAIKIVCGIVDGQAVHMFLQCSDLFFLYLIPAMNASI